MRKIFKSIGLSVCLVSLNTHAAQPKSVRYIEDVIIQGDQMYAYYIVKCSNGVHIDVSAWNERKLWCIGNGEKTDCKKKQIKIAKLACKGV